MEEEEIALLNLSTLTPDHIMRYLDQRKARLKNPSVQDAFLKLVSEYVYAVDMGLEPEELRERHKKLMDVDNIHKSIAELVNSLKSKKKEPKPRAELLTKERCQTAAKILWKENPTMTISDVAIHELVYNLEITGGKNFELRTVRDWVADVFPKNQKKQIGRPRKKQK